MSASSIASLSEDPAHPHAPRPSKIRDPLEKLRRTNVTVQFVGVGLLDLGSALVIVLYVTGPPRVDDLATSVTAVLFIALVCGCLATLPCWVGAVMLCVGTRCKADTPPCDGPPPHARFLRLLSLVAFLMSTLYAISGIVLYVLLQERQSFVDFCLSNLSSSSTATCTTRYNRSWLIMFAVALEWISHVALGFPVYRYTRGPQGGRQLEEGWLMEMGSRGAVERDRERERRGRTSLTVRT
ncbi:hypothetical protein JCM10212_006181 [Sporobolomyces blumeae]